MGRKPNTSWLSWAARLGLVLGAAALLYSPDYPYWELELHAPQYPKGLHVYGTPFFIEGDLPIESERARTPFRRLMIAQDTGSAIVGPARADLYFGAGAEAGRVAGRLKNNARFVMLVPKALDPVARGRKLPVPDERPSAKIARLFPQGEPAKPTKEAAPSPATPAAGAQASIPLPAARPKEAPVRDTKRPRQSRDR